MPPHEIARRGVARTFQNIELFEHATVLQNLLLGRHAHAERRFLQELLFCRWCAPVSARIVRRPRR